MHFWCEGNEYRYTKKRNQTITESLHWNCTIDPSQQNVQTWMCSNGLTSRPSFANIFMVELRRNVIPTLPNDIPLWKRYVDDTLCFIKLTSINKVSIIIKTSNSSLELKQKKKFVFRCSIDR